MSYEFMMFILYAAIIFAVGFGLRKVFFVIEERKFFGFAIIVALAAFFAYVGMPLSFNSDNLNFNKTATTVKDNSNFIKKLSSTFTETSKPKNENEVVNEPIKKIADSYKVSYNNLMKTIKDLGVDINNTKKIEEIAKTIKMLK